MKMFEVKLGNSFFALPKCLFEDMETWVHEFTEDCLVDTIEDAFDLVPYSRRFKVAIGGVSTYVTIWHIMASLHTKSMITSRVVNPDEFYSFVRGSIRKANKQ